MNKAPLKDRPIDWPFIYFAHLGKTGGTSVRHAAYSHFGQERCLCLYAKGRSGNTGGAFELYEQQLAATGKPRKAAKAVVRLIHKNKPAFFSTHSNGIFARFLPPQNTVTFVRHPVERAISQYNFWRHLGRKVPAFEDYVERPHHQNLQSRTLRNIDLEEIAVVGVTNRLSQSIDLINRRFGTGLEALRSNKSKWRPNMVKRDTLPDPVIKRIEEVNADDMALFEQAQIRFERDFQRG